MQRMGDVRYWVLCHHRRSIDDDDEYSGEEVRFLRGYKNLFIYFTQSKISGTSYLNKGDVLDHKSF